MTKKVYTLNKERKIIYFDESAKLSKTERAKVEKEVQMYLVAGYELRAKVKRTLPAELQKQNSMKENELIQLLKDKGEKDLLKYYKEQKDAGVRYFVRRKDVLDMLKAREETAKK